LAKLDGFIYSKKQAAVRWLRPRCQHTDLPSLPALRVLALGIYLANKKNSAHQVISELNRPTHHLLSQQWIALGDGASTPVVDKVTLMRVLDRVPKFQLINQLLAKNDLTNFDVVMVFDDDIILPKYFLDRFLEIQYFCDFSLCQPCRNHNSWIDHPIVKQVEGSLARQTRFVEIGPVFSIRSDAFPLLLPFDESSPMGWGIDFVWPWLIESKNKKMGIIDAIPIDHSLRKPFFHYDWRPVVEQQNEYLAKTPHLSPEETFQVVKDYRLGK